MAYLKFKNTYTVLFREMTLHSLVKHIQTLPNLHNNAS